MRNQLLVLFSFRLRELYELIHRKKIFGNVPAIIGANYAAGSLLLKINFHF